MAYKFNTRIGFHLVGQDRRLTLPSLINLLQDCGGFHGTEVGFSNKRLSEMGLAWVICSWQIQITEMPYIDDYVEVSTYPYSAKYCLASRYYAIKSPEGKEYARANSLWVLMDINNYTPVKITKDFINAYGPLEDVYENFDFGDRKIELAEAQKTYPPIEAMSYMIDMNHHVNNEQYITICQSLLPEDFTYDFFRAEYKKQALLGDLMIPYIAETPAGYQISLRDGSNEPYFVGEWLQTGLR